MSEIPLKPGSAHQIVLVATLKGAVLAEGQNIISIFLHNIEV
jgi:hypothetical protein